MFDALVVVNTQLRLGHHLFRCILWRHGISGVVGDDKKSQCLVEMDQTGHRVDVVVRGQCEDQAGKGKVMDQLQKVSCVYSFAIPCTPWHS